VTSSIFKGLVAYHGSMEREIKLKNSNSNKDASWYEPVNSKRVTDP